MFPLKIIYSDEALTVAQKPVGVLSQPDKTGADSMLTLVAAAVEHPVFPIHRLDRAVGGVMVFAGNADTAAKLSAQIGNGRLIKEYLAVIHGKPAKDSGTLADYLLHDEKRNLTRVADKSEKGSKSATLFYRVLASCDVSRGSQSLLLIRLFTGRTHQIRVQFASRGMPLVGDSRYGVHDHSPLGLFAARLTFVHPQTGKPVSFSVLPTDEPFTTSPLTDYLQRSLL